MKYLLVSLLFISGVIHAKTYDLKNRFGIGGGAGWTYPVGDGQFNDFAEDEFTYNLHLRYHTSRWDALQFNYQNYEFEDTSIGGNVYDLMWMRRINPGDRMTPIFGLAVGFADMRNIQPFHDQPKFAGRARLGLEYALTPDVFMSATVDYQYIGQMPDNKEDTDGPDKDAIPGQEIHAIVPQLNLTVFFGHDKEIKESHKGAAVVAAAAVIDTDRDGVGDPTDKCPGTPQGSAVNAYGCLANEKANVELEILFATGSAQIPPASQVAVQDLGRFMKDHPETKVEVQGHTDNSGNNTRNKKLSQDRANAVKTYLVEKMNIPASRVSAYGYGEEKPVADNTTPEGRNKNRRVMAVISQ
jgi:outer membrane protein OmpA-like peptidoglycan-associated protein